ncbi:MAG: hypothetical protein AMS15_08230 [Planctomycetes bacterium DG_23]|nr:MAG: hypothetical protein AMS15_08230 [Planctomycetes bacterium DG_23]
MELETVYFDSPGPQNTDEVLQLVKRIAEEEGIEDIILATTRGYTGLKALEVFKGKNVIGVGSYRSRSDPARMQEFQEKGAKLIYAFEDVQYDYPRSVQSEYRHIAGEGGKVCPEVVVAAVKAGFIPEGKRVIGIGGTFPGADTAFVIISAADFSKIKIESIICTPRRDQ